MKNIPGMAGAVERLERLSVGRLRGTVLRDGDDPCDLDFVFGDASPDVDLPLVEGRLDTSGMLSVAHNPVLVQGEVTQSMPR